MSKDPAFLFYPNDYIGGTMGMTFEEKGAYIELLMMQFNRGHMTSHMVGQTVGHLWDKVQDKFIQDGDGLWFNRRLEDEQTKRKEFCQSRRNNKDGINQYSKKEDKNTGHMTSHMENENEDVNKNGSVKLFYAKQVKDNSAEKFINDYTQIANGLLTHDDHKPLQKLKWLTFDQYSKLAQNYPAQSIADIFIAMSNHKPLVKKNQSLYLTARNWLKR